jgi:hypothetical protein
LASIVNNKGLVFQFNGGVQSGKLQPLHRNAFYRVITVQKEIDLKSETRFGVGIYGAKLCTRSAPWTKDVSQKGKA